MITVIGVRFKKAGKVYYFDPCDVWPRPGEQVVVETSRGIELGEVVTGAREVPDDQITQPLKKVLRAALAEDIQRAEINARKEKEAFPICQERIQEHGLDMKLVDVEYTFDNSKIIFYFTSDGRVDFRDLVKDLASIFKMRIELRQIGVRDEAKMLGGLGACGRPICCAAFMGDFQPLSIKMAKEQNLSLNPVKISGQCGRLMCCLRYEQDFYEQTLRRAPRIGSEVITPDGPGIVSDIFVIREKVRVRIRGNDGSYDMREFPLDDVYRPGKPPTRRTESEETHKEETETAEQPALSSPDSVQPQEPQAEELQNSPAPEQTESPEEQQPRRRSPRGRSGRRILPAQDVPTKAHIAQEAQAVLAEERETGNAAEASSDQPFSGNDIDVQRRKRKRSGRPRRKEQGEGSPLPDRPAPDNEP